MPTATLDSIIPADGVGLVWIDTQGHEGHVLSGASQLLASQAPIVLEFWPYGLDQVDGYRLVREQISRRARIVDLSEARQGSTPRFLAPSDLDQMYEDMLRRDARAHSPHTDLLLI